MEKKLINLNNLEKFLEKAQNKLNTGIENIGESNMIHLDNFLQDIRLEKKKKHSLNSHNKSNEFNDFSMFNEQNSDNKIKLKDQINNIYFDLKESSEKITNTLDNQNENINDAENEVFLQIKYNKPLLHDIENQAEILSSPFGILNKGDAHEEMTEKIN